MSQENVDSVRAIHEAWARGDFGARTELLADDFSWDQHAEAVEAGSRRGAEVGQSLRRIFEVYDDYRITADEFIDAGDHVVVMGRAGGTAKASRMELDQRFAFVWTVHRGRLARLQVFTDRRDALEAAGLSQD
jgi:ketosteroid isomerase-like protein